MFPNRVNLLDGIAIAKQIKEEISTEVKALLLKGIKPGLAAILVGDNPASKVYVASKTKTCEQLGLHSETHLLGGETSTNELIGLIKQLNQRDNIDGILVQMPLPSQIDSDMVLEAVDPSKDVDGFHPENIGKLALKQPRFVACTPAGVMEILKRSNIEITGKHAVVIGRSRIVGIPMSLLLTHADATVTICHSKTSNLAEIASSADILIAAMGRTAFIAAKHIKQGAAVIDVGINRLDKREDVLKYFPEDQKRLDDFERKGSVLIGDVDPRGISQAGAAHFTPVPGGVGPLTIAMLIKNTVEAARLRRL
jgi:methylenetetrahydrofolate dehydrogenase (NADP+)/methenyltetrahydrofolate cyclohydrolase